MSLRIDLYNRDGWCGRADNISCADDWAENASGKVYTTTRMDNGSTVGLPKLWGSSFYNLGAIESYWVHSKTRGDILRSELKKDEEYEPVTIPEGYRKDYERRLEDDD